jgi:hypothetical protein
VTLQRADSQAYLWVTKIRISKKESRWGCGFLSSLPEERYPIVGQTTGAGGDKAMDIGSRTHTEPRLHALCRQALLLSLKPTTKLPKRHLSPRDCCFVIILSHHLLSGTGSPEPACAAKEA